LRKRESPRCRKLTEHQTTVRTKRETPPDTIIKILSTQNKEKNVAEEGLEETAI
jgi:hypothetical protein